MRKSRVAANKPLLPWLADRSNCERRAAALAQSRTESAVCLLGPQDAPASKRRSESKQKSSTTPEQACGSDDEERSHLTPPDFCHGPGDSEVHRVVHDAPFDRSQPPGEGRRIPGPMQSGDRRSDRWCSSNRVTLRRTSDALPTVGMRESVSRVRRSCRTVGLPARARLAPTENGGAVPFAHNRRRRVRCSCSIKATLCVRSASRSGRSPERSRAASASRCPSFTPAVRFTSFG